MLLTSSQVSLAISSTIVFIFTTALFLCGYVVQQNTMNNIRQAIKPHSLLHTNLYVPPEPGESPAEIPLSGDDIQVIETIEWKQSLATQEDQSAEEVVVQQTTDEEIGDELIQGKDGGFLRISKGRQGKQKPVIEDIEFADLVRNDDEQSYNGGSLNPNESADKSRDSTLDSKERLSRAARRKRIKDEIIKIAGPENKRNQNPYRRRRNW